MGEDGCEGWNYINYLQASRYAKISWNPEMGMFSWTLKGTTKKCQFTGTVESKMFFKFAVSRDYCKDETKVILGPAESPDVTKFYMGYCGLASPKPYNYSLIVSSFPDKGYLPAEAAAKDPDARGWAVELEDTFIDCFNLADAASAGHSKKLNPYAVMADCRDRCMHWRGGFATKGTVELPGAFPFLYFPLRGEVRHFKKQVAEVAKTSYGALEPTMIMLLTANYDCLTFSFGCSTPGNGEWYKFSYLTQYEPVMFYYLAQASSMLTETLTAPFIVSVAGGQYSGLLKTLQGCVEDEGAWQCPSVYCGDATVEYGTSSFAKVESDFYVTGNLTYGVSMGVPINCSTVFRACHMEGTACTGAEALGQKNRPLSLAMQYDEVSIQWDWAAPSGAAALALIKPECPHVVSPALKECKYFDGLYYSTAHTTNESWHYYAPIAYMPTAWAGEIWKIVKSTGTACGGVLEPLYVQKMHLAKLYADKLDTLASERFTIINTVHLDSLFNDPLMMLKDLLSGRFQFCYKGYSCGMSLYDATYLASMVASMMFLKETAQQYAFDPVISGMYTDYYGSYAGTDSSYAMYMTIGCGITSCTYGDSWFNYQYSSYSMMMKSVDPSFYYYQYAHPSRGQYPLLNSKNEIFAIYKQLFACFISGKTTADAFGMSTTVAIPDYSYDKCPPVLVCLDSCTNPFFVSDGNCDDGGPGSEFIATQGKYGYCEPGSDCEDCGDRWLVWNPAITYVDFCDNVKACAQSFGGLFSSGGGGGGGGGGGPPAFVTGRRRLGAATLSAGNTIVLLDGEMDFTVATFTDCFDLYTLELNGTTPKKFLKKWVLNRANLSLVVGLYDTCYLCQDFLKKLGMGVATEEKPKAEFKELLQAAVQMIKVFYYVYKPTAVLPLMPHCDNDFESMALKHSIGFDKSEVGSEGCPFMPSYLDAATESWDETSKAAKSFLNTLYRFVEVLQGKELF